MTKTVTEQQVDDIKQWLGSGSINIFGLPFAGKDTQAKLIGGLLDAPVIGGGDILRSHPEQARIKELMLTGQLFPTDFYLSVILPFLKQPEFAGRPLVLSSVGRWHGEEEAVTEAAADAGHAIKVAIFLDLDDDEVWNRFEATQTSGDRGARHDDAEHLIETRLTEFRNKTVPVLDFYRERGMLIEVDGKGNPDIVTTHILDAFTKFINR
jgi:adenylate kinase